jgi:hypothetical protein
MSRKNLERRWRAAFPTLAELEHDGIFLLTCRSLSEGDAASY